MADLPRASSWDKRIIWGASFVGVCGVVCLVLLLPSSWLPKASVASLARVPARRDVPLSRVPSRPRVQRAVLPVKRNALPLKRKKPPARRVALLSKPKARRVVPRRVRRSQRARARWLKAQRRKRVRVCYQALQRAGVRFRRRRNPYRRLRRRHRCSVEGAVSLYPPLHGVDWVNGHRERVPLFMRCELALALSRWSRHLATKGITRVMHFGTYNCKLMRKDRGFIGKMSQHGLGRAVDVAAFWDRHRNLYSLSKHWDHKTRWKNRKGKLGCWSTTFRHFKAKRLYRIACDMWRLGFFSQVLTPNFNRVHDDHFHMEAGYPRRVGPGQRGELDGIKAR